MRTDISSKMELLSKELEVQGEELSRFNLEHRAQMDELRLGLEAIKAYLSAADPVFRQRFQEAQEQVRREFDPETEESD